MSSSGTSGGGGGAAAGGSGSPALVRFNSTISSASGNLAFLSNEGGKAKRFSSTLNPAGTGFALAKPSGTWVTGSAYSSTAHPYTTGPATVTSGPFVGTTQTVAGYGAEPAWTTSAEQKAAKFVAQAPRQGGRSIYATLQAIENAERRAPAAAGGGGGAPAAGRGGGAPGGGAPGGGGSVSGGGGKKRSRRNRRHRRTRRNRRH